MPEEKKIKVNIKKLEKSEIEIEGEISGEDFSKYWEKAIKKMGENLELPGFRKGHIPENIILKNVPEITILEEMAQMALNEFYPQILMEEKIDAIGRPEIFITKIAKENPLGFKIKTAVMPKIKLSDYKKIAKEENKNKSEVLVSDEDVEKAILEIRKMRVKKENPGEEENPPAGGEENLPVFDDNFVKELGNFSNVSDFKNKLRENIKFEKEMKEKEKTRLNIVEKIIKEMEGEIPKLLVDLELGKMMARVKNDVEAMGFKFEDYLKHLNKTEEEVKKNMEKDAEKQAKLQLAVNQISINENIKPNESDIENEVALILKQYKDANSERVRAYVENVLTNEKVFQFLENL